MPDDSPAQLQSPDELAVGPRLAALLMDCETVCVAGCCGLDAFDFSPLRLAASLTKYDGWNESQVATIRDELTALETAGQQATADENGLVGCSETLNQCFTADSLAALVAQLRTGLDEAAKLVPYSRETGTA